MPRLILSRQDVISMMTEGNSYIIDLIDGAPVQIAHQDARHHQHEHPAITRDNLALSSVVHHATGATMSHHQASAASHQPPPLPQQPERAHRPEPRAEATVIARTPTSPLGHEIRTWRERHRLTQAEASKILGFSQSMISAWESGREVAHPGTQEGLRRSMSIYAARPA